MYLALSSDDYASIPLGHDILTCIFATGHVLIQQFFLLLVGGWVPLKPDFLRA